MPITNLHVKNGAARGNVDITDLLGEITYVDTETARVYKIDTSGLTDGLASLATNAV